MPTAREILINKLNENDGVLIPGQMKWILEAMEEHKKYKVEILISEKIRKAKVLRETKKYSYDLGNAEKLSGYIKALEELQKEFN